MQEFINRTPKSPAKSKSCEKLRSPCHLKTTYQDVEDTRVGTAGLVNLLLGWSIAHGADQLPGRSFNRL